jgi:hypothetical protein
MSETKSITEWAGQARKALGTAERLSDSLDAVASIPAGGDPSERLAVLNEIWAAFGVARPNFPAIDDRAANLGAKVKADDVAVRYSFRLLLHSVHEERTRLILLGVSDAKHPVLRKAD